MKKRIIQKKHNVRKQCAINENIGKFNGRSNKHLYIYRDNVTSEDV